MTIKRKFIFSISLSIILTAILITVMSYYSVKSDTLKKEGIRLHNIARESLYKIDQIYSARKNEILMIAGMDIIQSSFEYDVFDQTADLLKSFLAGSNIYDELYIVNSSGKVVASSDETRSDGNGTFISINSGNLILSQAYFDKEKSKYLSDFIAPIYLEGKQVAILTARYNYKHMFDALDETKVLPAGQSKEGHIMIFDQKGLVLYAPPFERENDNVLLQENLQSLNMSSVDQAIEGKEGILSEQSEHGNLVIVGFSFSAGPSMFRAIVQRDHKDILHELGNLLQKMIFMVIVLVLAGVAVALFIASRTIRPIYDTTEMLKDIAEGEGDLTKRLELKRQDEIGKLARYFNLFTDKIQAIIAQVVDNAGAQSDLSQALLEFSNKMASGIESMSDSSSTVANAAIQMNNNMNAVSSAMSEAVLNINTVASVSETISENIKGVSDHAALAEDNTNNAVRKAKEASKQVNQLGEDANEIGVVMETIKAISDQTNLLALNATIEAARAGEAGKGFAVVANEIKALANQTTDATNVIKQKLEAIQASSNVTVTNIEEISGVIETVDNAVKSINDVLDDQKRATAEITVSISQASESLNEINENINHTSQASEQVTKEINAINVSSGAMSNISSLVRKNAEDMNQKNKELQKLMARFKI